MNTKPLLPLLLMVVLAGCATSNVQTQLGSGANPAAWKTYAWMTVPPAPSGDAKLDTAAVTRELRAAIDQELAAKNLRRVSPAEADVWLTYELAVKTKVDQEATSIYLDHAGGMGRFGQQGLYRTSTASPVMVGKELMYKEGTLFIEFVDPKTRTLAWRGLIRGAIDEGATPQERQRRIHGVVKRILSSLPR